MGEHDSRFMEAAFDAARESLARGDMPIGAVIVIDGLIVATGANAVDSSSDDTRHAEMVAISRCASRLFAAKRSKTVELFTTMEPCAMCFGAIAHFRIGRVVSAMDDSLAGVVDMFTDHPYYAARGTEWVRGFRSEDAHELLIEYQLATGQRPHLRSVRRQDRYRLEPDEQS